MGFKEFHSLGLSSRLPKMMGFQAEGAAPIVAGHPIDSPNTIATAIRIGNPASWRGALRAKEESGGIINQVSDEEILEAYVLLSRKEGIFCEPASAAPIAGLTKLVQTTGLNLGNKAITCVITGSGLKDPALVRQVDNLPVYESTADIESITKILTGP
jgi:threonine synthase